MYECVCVRFACVFECICACMFARVRLFACAHVCVCVCWCWCVHVVRHAYVRTVGVCSFVSAWEWFGLWLELGSEDCVVFDRELGAVGRPPTAHRAPDRGVPQVVR